MKAPIYLILIFFSFNLLQAQPKNFDIRNIPITKNINEYQKLFKQRSNLLLEKWKNYPLNEFPFYQSENKGLNSLTGALARIKTNHNIEEVNEYLLDERLQAGLHGTRINLLWGLCKRKGDYDFALQELIRVAYLGKDVISKKAYDRLTDKLLTLKGDDHYESFKLGLCGKNIKDTENHILMSETARYLTNQIEYKKTSNQNYNNISNGFEEWMLKHLKHYLIHGFSEINSRPYNGYTISALLNLFDFSDSLKVKTAAYNVLEYLMMKYAIESIGNRRLPTFRRQIRRYLLERLDDSDPLNSMMMVWSGDYQYLLSDPIDLKAISLPYNDRFGALISISNYRPSSKIINHILNPTKGIQFYDHDHNGKQIVYRSNDFVISAGGTHRALFPKISLTNDVLANPTILIARKNGSKLSDFFYFLGHKKAKKRSNLCVSKNFLCGKNLFTPTNTIKECVIKQDNWYFYDFKSKPCQNQIYQNIFIAQNNINKKFSLLAIEEELNDFELFIELTLKNNSNNFSTYSQNEFTHIDGTKTIFEFKKAKGEYNVENQKFNNSTLRVRGDFHNIEDDTMWITDNKKNNFYYFWPK